MSSWVDAEQARREAARASSARSVRLSAWAWSVLVLGLVPLPLVGDAGRVLALALLVAVPIAFVVLTVLAVRAAWRGLDSGYPVTRWANVLAVLDVIGAVLVVIGVGLLVLLVVSLSRCASDPGCQLFTF